MSGLIQPTAGEAQTYQKSYEDTTSNALQQARPGADYIIGELFKYHAPNSFQQQQYGAIRSAAKHFAEVVLANTPHSADRTAAIRKIREAVMTANAAIALNGLNL